MGLAARLGLRVKDRGLSLSVSPRWGANTGGADATHSRLLE